MHRQVDRRMPVFLRYALSYTMVVLILFGGISVYLFSRTGQQVQESIVDSQINRLTRIALQHEGNISAMLNAAAEIALNPYIEPFVYEREPWRAYDLQRQLLPYTSTNAFCDQIYLYFAGDDRIYSSSSAMSLSMFTGLMVYESMDADELAKQIRETDRLTVLPAQRIVSDLVDGTEPRMVTFLMPLGAGIGNSDGCLIFLIKESSYQGLFADAIGGELNTYIFEAGVPVATLAPLPAETDNVQAVLERQPSSGTFRWNREDWLYVSLGTRSWGFQYVTVLRMRDVYSAVYLNLKSMLLMLVVITILCLALAFAMARHQAKPIQVLSDMLPTAGMPGRHDELQQISTGIQQLTQHNHDLISRLDRALPMQRHDFVFQFVKGRFPSREAAVSAASAVGIDIDRQQYAVILCSVPESWDHPLELGQMVEHGDNQVTGAGVELMALKAILYLVFADSEALLIMAAEQIRRAGQTDGERCITAISAVHAQFEEAPGAYLEAAAAYDNRFAMGGQQVLRYSAVSAGPDDILEKAQKLTTAISQALILGNRDMLMDRITELLSFLKNTDMSPFAFRMIYNDVIHTLTRAQGAEWTQDRDTGEFYDIFTLASCQSIDDLDALLRRLCTALLAQSEKAAEMSDGVSESPADVISQVTEYMELHFNDPEISMAAIAESFDLSTTRLSLSFKERVGMTPLEYLTLLRTEEAKRLLSGTNMTIRDIGTQVGYYDSGSFIRRFKQLTGMTPLQYRHNSTESAGENGQSPVSCAGLSKEQVTQPV